MLFTKLASALVLAAVASAHHMMTQISINGRELPPGKCIRMPPTTAPVVNINSNDMSCNVNGHNPVARVCPVTAGSSITFRWRTWPNASQSGSLDVSHQGPCAVYMKLVTDATKSPAYGAGWFKIWEDGFRDGKFCSQRLIENDGKMTVTIPKDLVGGDYIIRAEQVALHQGQILGGAQWYIGCAQLTVSANGGRAYPPWIRIPGHVKADHPGVLFDYWRNKDRGTIAGYKIPGPAVYRPGSGSGFPTENRRERGNWSCVVENANWCARKVPGFNSEGECYSAVKNCWDQLNNCYNTAPATGNAGCKAWEDKCEAYQRHCQSCGAGCRGSFPN